MEIWMPRQPAIQQLGGPWTKARVWYWTVATTMPCLEVWLLLKPCKTLTAGVYSNVLMIVISDLLLSIYFYLIFLYWDNLPCPVLLVRSVLCSCLARPLNFWQSLESDRPVLLHSSWQAETETDLSASMGSLGRWHTLGTNSTLYLIAWVN